MKRAANVHDDIKLRPRFQRDLDNNKAAILQAFDEAALSEKKLKVKRVDDHIFITLSKKDQHFWSPQLHLELADTDNGQTKLYGLFGPNPNIWLVFMFLHFVVATIFIGFGIWAYSNWSLEIDYFFQALVAGSMIVVWILLYIIGRFGRDMAKPQMKELHAFFEEVLKI